MCLRAKKKKKEAEDSQLTLLLDVAPLLCKKGCWMLPQSESFKRADYGFERKSGVFSSD